MAPRTQHRVSAYISTAVVAVLLAAASPTHAQYLDPDACLTCQDKREHFLAGAGLDLLARGPWVASSFRNTAWKRVALTTVVATSWELIETAQARRDGKAGQPGYGFSPLDIAATVAGAITVEGLDRLLHQLIKRR